MGCASAAFVVVFIDDGSVAIHAVDRIAGEVGEGLSLDLPILGVRIVDSVVAAGAENGFSVRVVGLRRLELFIVDVADFAVAVLAEHLLALRVQIHARGAVARGIVGIADLGIAVGADRRLALCILVGFAEQLLVLVVFIDYLVIACRTADRFLFGAQIRFRGDQRLARIGHHTLGIAQRGHDHRLVGDIVEFLADDLAVRPIAPFDL